MQQAQEFLTTNDAAKIANKSGETIRLWARSGRLPSIRTASGVHLFRREDVLKAMEAAASAPATRGDDTDAV